MRGEKHVLFERKSLTRKWDKVMRRLTGARGCAPTDRTQQMQQDVKDCVFIFLGTRETPSAI